MANWTKKIENFAPDIAKTIKRFPLPVLFLAIATFLFIAIVNNFLSEKDNFWPLLAAGFATAAIFALAGRLFNESKSTNIIALIVLEIIVPIAVIAAMQIKSFTLFVPFFLPLIGIFWLSISPFTKIGKGGERQDNQDKFWIINHRAIVSAIIASFGFGVIALGLIVIERSLFLLFELDVLEIFYSYLLPFAGFFLVPIYWLSTIENLDKLEAKELETPDFISKAIGFLGQFLFVPVLFVYALILLAYGVQIAITQTMPVGMLGWMVIGFTITGVGTWLLVYPSFIRKKLMVRLFRKTWFWLTIIPLILFVIGVYIRVNAYGLTSPRMLLIAGGVWAALLTVIFLSKKFADIRLIPLLAGLIFLVLSIGPFNVEHAPNLNQAERLKNAMISAVPVTNLNFFNPNWNEENAKKAIGAVKYLYKNDEGKVMLEEIFVKNSLNYDPNQPVSNLLKQLKLDNFKTNESENKNNFRLLRLAKDNYPNLSKTSYYLGKVEIYEHISNLVNVGELGFKILPEAINITDKSWQENNIKLADWLKNQEGEFISNPELDFTINNINYRLIIEFAALDKNQDKDWSFVRLEALLFSSEKPLPKQ